MDWGCKLPIMRDAYARHYSTMNNHNNFGATKPHYAANEKQFQNKGTPSTTSTPANFPKDTVPKQKSK